MNAPLAENDRAGWKGIVLVLVLSLVYLLYSWFSIGLRNDQLMLVTIVNVSYMMNGFWRRFILGFAIFIVYWIIFDSMKLFPNYLFHHVHVESLYNLEKSVFGIVSSGTVLTPNEYFLQHNNALLDGICAAFYLSWIPIPLLFAFYLFRKAPMQFLHFALAFFFTNIIGFIIYYTVPAAPPWYVQLHGFAFDPSTHGNAAGLLRFDDMAGVHLFRDMYAKGSNVFAAMPSLHSAYPVLGVYYSYKLGKKSLTLLFSIFMIGIWFSAVYLTHHYILDVIAGLLCAVVSLILFENLLLKSRRFRSFLSRYEKIISVAAD